MSTASTPDRRSFLKQSAAGVAAATTLAAAPAAQAAGANEKLTVGLIGCGGRGPGVAGGMTGIKNVEVTHVCDPDERRLAGAAKRFGVKEGRAVKDLRKMLDDKSLDAVIVATPDHWHAPASILALDAGKHVYVEKPCSHNLREGRLLVEAARRNKRVVQHGTQSRSSRLIADGVQMLREGVIGDVLVAKAWNIQRRGNIGHAQPSAPPAGFDYDLWLGPAPKVPYQTNRHHYSWHWWYDFGTGDAGNDGVHEIDYARWGLGVETHPSLISAIGGKFFHDDDQQFPDTQSVLFEYPGDGKVGQRRMLIFEMRLWDTCYPYNVDNGTEFYGTHGKMILTKRGKLLVYGERNKKLDAKPKQPYPLKETNHQQDFIAAIREGRKPQADIEIGHLSASLCHLGNIATRVGRSLQFDPATEKIVGDEEASKLLSRNYRKGHWAVPKGV
ncbi:MAG: Gfo/Idh/MocA family oxidoreductase [Planctomycetes bacterium]|nr:Gfo/Idh/MocA family oxidoreductase [Planctomycetota bacterium]